ncbi:MAG: type IV secretion protein Rhs [Deltaproteobacteria bacterium]|nr:type IV secretion protein Rhs [Deltaproteobacteria bacterium]
MSAVTDSSGGITTYLYDAAGNQVGIEQANGSITTSFYDNLNRLTSQVSSDSLGNPLTSFDYILDPVGNRLQVTEISGRVVDYNYDALYRLVSEDVTDPVNGNVIFEYTYDAVGNRLTKSVNGGLSESYTYDDNDRLRSSSTSSYSYDDNGNTLTETVSGQNTTYTYDVDDRLVKAITPSDIVEYSYDTDGIRQSKRIDGVLTSYLVDKNRPYAQVLEELDNGGSVIVEYTYGADLLSQNSASNGQSYYHYDGLGSTRGLSDATETLTDTYDYEAFGELLSSAGSTPNSYLFAGEQLDSSTGKYYLRARYYTPFNGRFSQMDSFSGFASRPASLNKFIYANSNPVSYTDPSGQISIGAVSATVAISGVLNTVVSYDPSAPLSQIATNFAVGGLEGVIFLGGGAVAVKGAVKLARFIKVSRLTGPIQKVFSKLIPLGPNLPGSNIPTRFILNTSQGKVLFSSGLQGEKATGAFKHMFNEVLRKQGRSAGSTVLAEALAIQEMQAVAETAILQGIPRLGQRFVVRTQFAEWTVVFETEMGLLKLVEAIPRIL